MKKNVLLFQIIFLPFFYFVQNLGFFNIEKKIREKSFIFLDFSTIGLSQKKVEANLFISKDCIS